MNHRAQNPLFQPFIAGEQNTVLTDQIQLAEKLGFCSLGFAEVGDESAHEHHHVVLDNFLVAAVALWLPWVQTREVVAKLVRVEDFQHEFGEIFVEVVSLGWCSVES